MKKPILSYTTINNIHIAPHSYLNKLAGIKTPTSDVMNKGKEAHEKLQRHLLGIEKLPINLDLSFGRAEYHARKDEGDFIYHGYLDCVSFDSKTMVEIKTTGSKTWTLGDFEKHPQGAYYSWVTGFRKIFYITCKFDLSDLKTYYKEFTDEDMERSKQWALEASSKITEGKLKEDLVDNKCVNYRCPYGSQCLWK